MLIKATVLGCALASTPICIAVTMQDKTKQDVEKLGTTSPRTQAKVGWTEGEALREEIRKLQSALQQASDATRRAEERAEETRRRIHKLQKDLADALNLLTRSTEPRRRRNCSPSRSRSLLTYYQWMQQRGYKEHANKMLTRVIKETGDRPSNLNSLAWRLMTNKQTVGKFDQAALALAERMQQHRRLQHQQLDTIALAKFLNGKVDEAVKLQLAAMQHSNNDEYRRRLRVYQVAAAQREVAAQSLPAVAGGGGE